MVFLFFIPSICRKDFHGGRGEKRCSPEGEGQKGKRGSWKKSLHDARGENVLRAQKERVTGDKKVRTEGESGSNGKDLPEGDGEGYV